MSYSEFLINYAELSALHDDNDIKQEIEDREEYLKYLGTDYEKYINWIQKHNYKHGKMWGHRRDVCNFFQNMDENKKNQLIWFFKEINEDLFNALFKIPTNEEQIEKSFKETIESNWEKIQSIIWIHKEDLQFLFRGKPENQTINTLISYWIDYYKKSNNKK